jgi:hypothetical protein
MSKEDLNIFIRLSIFGGVLLAILYLSFQEKKDDIAIILRAASFAWSIVSILWWLFLKWGWQYWPSTLLFHRPSLNGTWLGTLQSDYQEDGIQVQPKPFCIVVRQTFLSIHIKSYTTTSLGVSYAEALILNKEIGERTLAYLYRQDSSRIRGNKSQLGDAELRIVLSIVNRLEGRYWTDSKTQGEVSLKFVSEKHVDSFDDAIKLEENGK